MSRIRNKIAVRVRSEKGYEIKAWKNVKTGDITPTNWKIAAGHLAGPAPLTKRQANRREHLVRAPARHGGHPSATASSGAAR